MAKMGVGVGDRRLWQHRQQRPPRAPLPPPRRSTRRPDDPPRRRLISPPLFGTLQKPEAPFCSPRTPGQIVTSRSAETSGDDFCSVYRLRLGIAAFVVLRHDVTCNPDEQSCVAAVLSLCAPLLTCVHLQSRRHSHSTCRVSPTSTKTPTDHYASMLATYHPTLMSPLRHPQILQLTYILL